ncbi:hypothetical protein APC81_12280 [Acinetobacter baumannii]|nr:hypothetical protein APC81_12280 [Acinetobacter baumannii]
MYFFFILHPCTILILFSWINISLKFKKKYLVYIKKLVILVIGSSSHNLILKSKAGLSNEINVLSYVAHVGLKGGMNRTGFVGESIF